MTLEDKINEVIPGLKSSTGTDVQEMTEDIYYYLSELEQFEVLKIDRTGDKDRMILAACLTTMPDPFFKIVVAHTWQRDMAFDNEWSEFEQKDDMTIFRFLTWDDAYISGEIWFERAKPEHQNGA